MQLKGKNILIISSQPWEVNAPSRQLYARELALQGNQVYFLNPPSKLNSVTPRNESDNLFVVDYKKKKPVFAFLQGSAENAAIKRIQKLIGKKIDIVWSFDTQRFPDLTKFGADLKLFYLEEYQEEESLAKEIAASADLVFALSKPVSEQLGAVKTNKVIFQHGLNKAYVDALKRADKIRNNTQFTTGRLRCGYIGNLQSKYIDTEAFEVIIRQNPTVEFHLIGPFVKESNLASSGNKTWEDPFVEFLMNAPNVRMYGSLMIKRMAELMQTMDLHLVCYDASKYANQVANPQKMIEYFSTGKVVVANPTGNYQKHQDLLVMAQRQEELADLFKKTVAKIESHNQAEQIQRRIDFALAHQYTEQIRHIENELNKIGF